MFRHFSLRVKLSLLFLLIAASVGMVTVYQIRSINEFNARFSDLIDNDFSRIDQLEQLRFNVLSLERLAVTYMQDVTNGKKVDATEAQAEAQEIAAKIKENERLFGVYAEDDSHIEEGELALIAKQADASVDATLALLGSGLSNRTQLTAMQDTAREHITELRKLLGESIAGQSAKVRAEKLDVDAATVRMITTNYILAAGTAAAALALGLLTASILSRSIGRVKEGAQRVANGDFSGTIAVRSNDEIGQLASTFNKMAERLRESYARLALERQRDETLLESMSDGLIAIDNDGRIALVNSKAAEMLDINVRTTLMGRPIDEELVVYSRDDKPLDARYNPARTALETAKPVSDVFTYHKQDGRKITINITMSPVVVHDKTDGVIMVIRDVTHEMQVDRMKTEFISLASHQLRTPLSAIKWFSEMLLNGDAGELNPEQKDFAKNVSDSTDRMIQLVNSLLNISRIESGRIIIDPKPTDVRELVDGIVSDLKAKTAERQQNLIVSVHDGLPKINLDARLIGQVYMNLLTNAIKYTPKGGDIQVFVSRKDDQLVSQVTDNGYGIPKDAQKKIFGKFFRAENVAKVETDGTGLGLYLIKAIVESSGGKIWFESSEGKGTTFWFSLPMSGMKAKEGEVTLDA